MHATTRNKHSINVSCFKEFNESGNIKLFVYRFHNHFDKLIGLDLLTKWEAKIDLKNGILNTRSASNIIKMFNSKNVNLYEDIIPAKSSKLIRIPINAPDGNVLVPEQVVCNCTIRECITTVSNNRGILEIENQTENDLIISLDRPAQTEFHNIECTRTEQLQVSSSRVKGVVSRLRTEHLNAEEKANLNMLCSRYSDVFYLKGEPLSFTNKIKHCIRTKNEIPVYTISYRYPFIHRNEVRDQISKMLEQGIIRPSDSA